METNYQKAKRTLIAHAAIAGIELPEDGTILRMLKLASTPDVVNENDLSHSVTPAFKKGDKITLNTGHRCDTGKVIRCDEFNIVWESVIGGEYNTPLSMYNVTLLNGG
jgi:hypothetical protein